MTDQPMASTFEVFWAAYPRRVGKGTARKAFDKALTKTTLEVILVALTWQRNQAQWTKDGGTFIPHPTTWLNGERWSDEAPAVKTSPWPAHEAWRARGDHPREYR